MNRYLLAPALVAALLTVQAHAADAPNAAVAPSSMTLPLDLDKDGSLSKAEVKNDKMLSSRFDTMDANKDGKLDAKELETSAPSGASHSH